MSLLAPALDHLIHLDPSVSSLESSIDLYTSLGFLVTRGGNHADLLTTNALIVLPDGVYIELIAFLDYDTPGLDRGGETREQWEVRRKGHWWAAKKEGWIDWCLAGGVQDGQVEAINARAQAQEQPLVPTAKGDTAVASPGVYKAPRAGGRTTLRGDQIKWNVTFPHDALTPLALPFWCEDLTPRSLRVPPPTPLDEAQDQTQSSPSPKPSPHPIGVSGVHSLLFLFDETRFEEAMQAWSLVLPKEGRPGAVEEGSSTFLLSTPTATASASHAKDGTASPSPSTAILVHARRPQNQEERDWLSAHSSGQADAGTGTGAGAGAGALYRVELGLPTSAPPHEGEGEVERSTFEHGLGRISVRHVGLL